MVPPAAATRTPVSVYPVQPRLCTTCPLLLRRSPASLTHCSTMHVTLLTCRTRHPMLVAPSSHVRRRHITTTVLASPHFTRVDGSQAHTVAWSAAGLCAAGGLEKQCHGVQGSRGAAQGRQWEEGATEEKWGTRRGDEGHRQRMGSEGATNEDGQQSARHGLLAVHRAMSCSCLQRRAAGLLQPTLIPSARWRKPR